MIILFCGMPGSGKTTIASRLVAQLAAIGEVKLLSSDRLRPPVYRRIFKTLETERGGAEYILLDATFYKKEWRDRVGALAAGDRVVTVYVDCPREVALKRNRERRPNIAERALHIVYHRMEPPAAPDLTIDTAVTSAEIAARRIFNFVIAANDRREQRP